MTELRQAKRIRLEETGGSRAVPELPGERLRREGKKLPRFVPPRTGSYVVETGMTGVVVVSDKGEALAMFNSSGHGDPDDEVRVYDLVNDIGAAFGRSGLPYSVDHYELKGEERKPLEVVEVFDAHDLGAKYTSEYFGEDGDDSGEEEV